MNGDIWIMREVIARAEKAEAALERIVVEAALYAYLRNRCSYSYGNGYTEPREHGIQYEWRQTAPDPPNLDESLAEHARGWILDWLHDFDPECPLTGDRDMLSHADALAVDVPPAIRAALAQPEEPTP